MNLRLIILMGSLFLSANSWAGGSTTAGGGGHGVFCRKPFADGTSSQPFTIVTLDMYEAKKLYKNYFWTSMDSTGDGVYPLTNSKQVTVVKELKSRQDKLPEAIRSMPAIQRAFSEAVTLVDRAVFRDELPVTNDQGELDFSISGGCELVQMGYFDRSSVEPQVMLNYDAAAMLHTTQLAVLLLHESLHRQIHAQQTTKEIREIVRYIFGDSKYRNVYQNQTFELLKRLTTD